MLNNLKFHFIAPTIIALIAGIISYYTNIDIYVSEYFYYPRNKSWFFEGKDGWQYWIFYAWNKYLIIIFGVTALLSLIYSFITKKLTQYRRYFLFIVAVVITVPATVAIFKHYSRSYCPKHYEIFGGYVQLKNDELKYSKPINRLIDKSICYNEEQTGHCGKCFPGGHTSGLFSWLALYFIIIRFRPNYKVFKRSVLFAVLTIPGIMGSYYQVAKGNHFIIDNVMTFCVAWLLSYIFFVTIVQKSWIKKKI